jgi:hypothetical protein
MKASIATAGGLESDVVGDIVGGQAAEDELEQLLIGFETRVGVGKAKSQATLDRMSGKIAKRRGKNIARAKNIQLGVTAATTPFGGQGKTLLTGF